ncbi:MAG: hypothetical protein K2R98_18030 [Gemmataceae bacterium]|nr:hypothetical protein [Gemmataceae bacterium]
MFRLFQVGLAGLLLAVPARGAEVDKYLLNDTDGVLTVNVKQLAESPLFKKHYEANVRKLLGGPDLAKELKSLGLDPLKDVDRLIAVHGETSHRLDSKPGAKGESSIYFIARGKFDATRFHARADQMMKDYPELLKVHKLGTARMYEFALANPFFVAMPENTAIVASFFKDQVIDAIDKGAGKKKTALKFKDVQSLIEKSDGKQTIWMAATARMVHSFETKEQTINGKKVEVQTKDTLANAGVDSISGGILVTDGIKTEVAVVCKDAATAKQGAEFTQMDLREAAERAWKAALNDKQFDPLLGYLRSLTATSKARVISIAGEVSAKDFADAFK